MSELAAPEVGAESVLPNSGDFFVTGVWWDGKPWASHISTTDLADSKARDEASMWLRRTWSHVAVCPGIWTCTCVADFEAVK